MGNIKENKSSIEHKPILYRLDVDGLRSIAVLSVILFHIWPHTLTGGFVGVDIFFVISGFLITSILTKELHSGTFTFKAFYTRRIKRILPVFFIVVFCTSIAAYFLLLPNFYLKFVETAVSASVYLSNVYFSKTSDYFALDSNAYPLLHTWSLSVEEQYYLFWPLVLMFLSKYTKKNMWITVIVIILLFSLSYYFSIYSTAHNTSFGYYSIFSRAFELMVGSILALLISSPKYKLRISSKVIRLITANFISGSGFALILSSNCFLNENMPFPGYIAIVPTLGAALIIYAGTLSHHSMINRVLMGKFFVAIGLISYSLYLWHWPLLAYWHYLNPDLIIISFKDGLVIFIATFVLAIASYFLIELPIKKRRYSFKSAFIQFQLLPLIFIVAMAGLVIKNKGLPNRLSKQAQLQNIFLSGDYCHNISNGNYANCIFGNKLAKPTNIILFGDSHAGSLSPFWNKVAKQQGVSIKIITTDSCYPLLDDSRKLPSTERKLSSKSCSNQIKYITEHINDYNTFILAASWERYESGGKMVPSTFMFDSAFESTLKILSNNKKRVIVIGDIPVDTKNIIARIVRTSMLPWAHRYRDLLKLESGTKLNQRIEKISLQYPNVYFFNTYDLTAQIKTFPYDSGFLLYKDSDHFNQHGSEILADYYLKLTSESQINNLLGINGK